MFGTRKKFEDSFSGLKDGLSTHRRSLGAFAVLMVAFVAFGGLSPVWAVVGLLVAVLWVAGVPHRDGDRLDAGTACIQAEPSDQPSHLPLPPWREMLDAIPDPALALDREQRVIAANGDARNLFPGIEGHPLYQVTRGPELLGAIDRAFKSLEPQLFEMHAIAPVERHHTGTVTPLRTAVRDASAPALLIVLRDRTEVEQLAQMRADFVANASHELRTPLTSLKGFVETLQGAAKDDPKARDQFLGIMQEQAGRMSRLIEDLLSLSRIEMRQHVAPTARVDLATVVTDAIADLRPLADAAQITIKVLPTTVPTVVVADRDELMQVVQNLIQNAIKYGKIGGYVDVAVTQAGQKLLLTVTDDGIGIGPQHLPRLSERFYRVSAKESRERGGTGLGLAIVKHIVNRHCGELRIESTPGKGSIFIVALPAVENKPAKSTS